MDRCSGGGAGIVVEVWTEKNQELAVKIVIINKSGSSQARNGCSADPVLTPTCVLKRSTGLLALFSCWALIETGRVIGGIIVCCRRHHRRSRF